MDWFRYYHGAPYDPKLTMIAKNIGVKRCEMTAFWDCILDRASQNSPRGSIAGIDLDIISFSQDISKDTLQKMLDALIEKGVIGGDFVCSWEKRQPKREDHSTDRVRVYRKNNSLKYNDSHANETHGNAVKRSETPEREREEREEKERKKEKGNPSDSNSRGTRFLDKSLSLPWKEFCIQKRPSLDPEEIFQSFKDYWISQPGAKGIKLDWEATWRNWVRNQRDGGQQKQNLFTRNEPPKTNVKTL